ncbi:aminoglycoside phosphotransferase family protein [Chloroflexi bacterium TSY]|nr:aminoglycoside phosphotransferase family protein [Chloroflexi bacterium TSY]
MIQRGQEQEAVVKLYLDAGQARSRRQYDGQQMFWHLGVAPRPLWFDRYPAGLARQILVYEWVDGQPLDANREEDLQALASIVAQVHNHDPADVRRFSPNPVNLDYFWRVESGSFKSISQWLLQIEATALDQLFKELVQNATALVEAALPLWAGIAPTPVHGDVRLENCLSVLGTCVLLDWEMFGLGDPALEIASFLYHNRSDLDEIKQQNWLDRYLANFDQKHLGQRIRVYSRILPLQSVCYLLNGLRNMSNEPSDELSNVDATLMFLESTLNASLEHTALTLNLELASVTELTSPFFQKINQNIKQ